MPDGSYSLDLKDLTTLQLQKVREQLGGNVSIGRIVVWPDEQKAMIVDGETEVDPREDRRMQAFGFKPCQFSGWAPGCMYAYYWPHGCFRMGKGWALGGDVTMCEHFFFIQMMPTSADGQTRGAIRVGAGMTLNVFSFFGIPWPIGGKFSVSGAIDAWARNAPECRRRMDQFGLRGSVTLKAAVSLDLVLLQVELLSASLTLGADMSQRQVCQRGSCKHGSRRRWYGGCNQYHQTCETTCETRVYLQGEGVWAGVFKVYANGNYYCSSERWSFGMGYQAQIPFTWWWNTLWADEIFL